MTLKFATNGHTAMHSLLDHNLPIELRRAMLADLAMSDESAGQATIDQILESARKGQSEAITDEKLKEAEELINEIKRGPLRPASFIGRADSCGLSPPRVEVRLASGETAYPIVVDTKLLDGLHCGDGVLVDVKLTTVLFRDPKRIETGEVARFERRLDGNQVLVTLRDHEPLVLLASDRLATQLENGEVTSGQQLLVCTRRQLALAALPPEDGLSHYRYLSRDPLPEVIVERDLGDPPRYISEVLEHIERELTRPELGRKYRLRRAMTKMLAGVSGSGKTLSIEGTIRAAQELVSRHTGVALDELPRRLMRLRMAALLSKWLGDSDKNIDRFFDEVLQLADEKLVGPDGVEYDIPVYVVIEECDSAGRDRGGPGDQVYDRIQTTLLERLDANARRFGSRLVIVLCTTNVPHLIDPAFLRRAGGTIEHFGRLTRKGFAAVLEKHLAGLPIAVRHGNDQPQRERQLLRHAVDWLFSPAGHDPGQVEQTYVGSSQPVIAYRRDFLTAGLVDRAVQQAAAEACRVEKSDAHSGGVTRELLLSAFDRQIRAIVDQLSPHNVQNYLTLPDGVRVAQVRRIEQPKLSLHELERAS